MQFTELPINLQTLELYNFEMFMRAFWLFLIISISLIYVFYWRKYKEDKTPFYSVALMRGIIYITSLISLVISPFLFLLMSPENTNILMVYVSLYVLLLGIYLLLLNADLIRFGFTTLLKMGGLNMGDEKDKLAYRKLFGKKWNK